MTRIYLIRHAEAEGNLYRRSQGQYDSLVTDRGLEQIAALRERFRDVPVDAVYSSDLYRTMKTASAIYETHGLTLHTDPGLREVDLGCWENLPWGEIAHRDPEQLDYFNANDPRWGVAGSETFPILRERLVSTLTKLAQRHDGQTIAVATHGMALRNLMTALMGRPVEEGAQTPHCDNTGVSLVEYDAGAWTIRFQNDNSHLSGDLSTFAKQKWWRPDAGFSADSNFRYRTLDPVGEGDFYYRCRRDAWVTIHGSLDKFDGEGFLCDAQAQARQSPEALWLALLGDEPAGLVQLDIPTAKAQGYGPVPFLYLLPEYRGQGLGVQLIGQAVSVFRDLGCDRLRLRCAPDNAPAQKFYARYGFHKIGEAPGSRVPLDYLEKYIGFES